MALRDKEQSSASTSEGVKHHTPNTGVLFRCIKFCFELFKYLTISLFTSVVISFIGVTFFWSEQGSEHERLTLIEELNFLTGGDISNDIFLSLLKSTKNNDIWIVPDYFGDITTYVFSVFIENANTFGEVANYTAKIFIIRLMVILSATPVLFVGIVGAVVVGLVERDLRRFNLARESSTRFHLFLNNIHIPLVAIIVLYLSYPLTANPLYFFAPSFAVFSFLVFYTTAGYKKYF